MSDRPSLRRIDGPDHVAAVRRRTAAVVRAAGTRQPPFAPERYAAACGVAAIIAADVREAPYRLEHRATTDGRAARTLLIVDRRLPPHTPQWNGAVALGLGETLVPTVISGPARSVLAEGAAADLLLPMAVFRPAAARTDLTMDGLPDLATRFAAPLRLTARQWLASGLWRGYALLWRPEEGGLHLRWRAASSGRFPPALALGADAASVWTPGSRLFATYGTGRPHHGIEEVRTGAGTAWWFTRFAVVREARGGVGRGRSESGGGGDGVFAMVLLAAGRDGRAWGGRAYRGRARLTGGNAVRILK